MNKDKQQTANPYRFNNPTWTTSMNFIWSESRTDEEQEDSNQLEFDFPTEQ